MFALAIFAMPLVASASDSPDPAAATFSGNFEMDLGAAPLRVAVDRPFLFHPVLDLQVFPSSAILNSVGGRQGSASLVGLGSAETAGGLLGQLVPSSAADVGGLLTGLPGLLGLPLPAAPLPPLPSDPFPPVPVPVPPPAPNTVNTNYPFTPDAQTGFGAVNGGSGISSGSGTAASHASANAVSSEAAATQVTSGLLGPTGPLSVGAVRSFTTGEVKADNVLGTATSILSDINILGVITVDSLKSVTTIVGDGTKAMSSSAVTLGKVTALGYPATIDAKGVTINGTPSLPDSTIATLNSQLADLLKQAGVTVTLAKEAGRTVKADSTSRAVTEAAGLKVDMAFTPDANVPVLGGSTSTVEIGLGYSRGSILTGPVFNAGASDGTTGSAAISGTQDNGSAQLPSTGVTGVDSIADNIGLGALPEMNGGTVALDTGGISPSQGGAVVTNEQVSMANPLSDTPLRWAAIWPLLLAVACVVAMVGNLARSRGAGPGLTAAPQR
ncbi:hypothetical protein [Sporichthya polymorpha]|uniref:hypothetical protein n=1 Tax=Sporichthya polymorpha TaxID=35751 RepID=UPI000375A427|nr:hypothetical protein [Sporichthya polymorpha]